MKALGPTLAFVIALSGLVEPAHAGVISHWEAASGLTPDQIINPWVLTDTASPEDPTLSGGLLTISTSANAENMAYGHFGPLVDTSVPFFVETRLRYDSGSTPFPAVRSPVLISLTTAPNIGNLLRIGEDSISFLAPSGSGPEVLVDTDDAFHTYRIEYDGAGGLELFYDGGSILTASTFNDAALNGGVERISWGELSSVAQGTSEWEFFRHNALDGSVAAVPEPSTWALLTLAGIGFGGYQLRRRRVLSKPASDS